METKTCLQCVRPLQPNPYQHIYELILSLNLLKHKRWVLKDELVWDDFRVSFRKFINEIPIELFKDKDLALYSNALLYMLEMKWNLQMKQFESEDVSDKSNVFVYFKQIFTHGIASFIPVVATFQERSNLWVIKQKIFIFSTSKYILEMFAWS